MNEDKIIDNIFKRLDGDLNETELRELEEHLRQNPEAARIADDYELMDKELDKAMGQTMDVDLRQDILKKINMETYRQQPQNQEILVRSFWSRPFVRYSFAFVLGVFTGILIFSFLKIDLTGGSSKTDELKGTFLDSQAFDNMKVADVLQFSSPVASAVCQVRYSSKIVEMRVELSSPEQVKATIEFNYNALQVLNVNSISVNDQTTAMSTGNYVQINNIGENKFVIQLYNKNSLPQNIDFKIYQFDSPVYQNSVQVNKE